MAGRDIRDFIADLTREKFMGSRLVQSAVIRQLEVIGEAAKRLSTDFRDRHASIPWTAIAGMRDRLIHGYDDIDVEVVWAVASNEVPALLARLEGQISDP